MTETKQIKSVDPKIDDMEEQEEMFEIWLQIAAGFFGGIFLALMVMFIGWIALTLPVEKL